MKNNMETDNVHQIELHRLSVNRLNPQKLQTAIDRITQRATGGNRAAKGWTCEINNPKEWKLPRSAQGKLRYVCKLKIACTPKRQRASEAIRQDWNNIVNIIGAAANSQKWQIAFVDGKTAVEKGIGNSEVGYVSVAFPDYWQKHLQHIYDRDSQLDIIKSAIDAAILSGFQDRFHCALIGPPASGKTETLRGFKAALGEEAVLEYDATATTQAGAIKDLDDRDELPRILIVEEIEKAPPESMQWLLSVMDTRGEIRKTNFRGSIQKETKLLTFATVNDFGQFNKVMYGALASRFSHHIFFQQPDRPLLLKILEREIERVKGKRAWIKPTLDFAEDQNIYDPRKVKAICLCGRDDLLNGSYQKKLKACSQQKIVKEE